MCGIEDYNTTSAPGTSTKPAYGPRCILTEKSNNGDMVVRVEWIKSFAANGLFYISIHDVQLPAITEANKQAQRTFNIIANVFVKELASQFYRLRTRNFYQPVLIDYQSPAASPTSWSISNAAEGNNA